MRISICKSFTFDAAHYLPHHDGKCKNLHGHTYKLEVAVSSNSLVTGGSSTGMVMDFGDLKIIVKRVVLDQLDHISLNYIWDNPTAEIMADWIFRGLKESIERFSTVKLDRVRLYETPDSYAEVKHD